MHRARLAATRFGKMPILPMKHLCAIQRLGSDGSQDVGYPVRVDRALEDDGRATGAGRPPGDLAARPIADLDRPPSLGPAERAAAAAVDRPGESCRTAASVHRPGLPDEVEDEEVAGVRDVLDDQ